MIEKNETKTNAAAGDQASFNTFIHDFVIPIPQSNECFHSTSSWIDLHLRIKFHTERDIYYSSSYIFESIMSW